MKATNFRSTASTVLAAGLYVAIAALFLQIEIFSIGTGQVGHAGGDLRTYQYPIMRYGFDQLRQGNLPLWNPYQSCGAPFLAAPGVGFFYPLYLPFLFLDTAVALDLNLLLHLAIAGLSMFLMCRHFKLAWTPALLAGLVYAYQGSLMNKLHYPGFLAVIAWIPLVFLLVDQVLLRPSLRAGAWVALLLASILLGGYLQFVYFTAWALVPFVFVRALRTGFDNGSGHVARAFSVLLLAAGLGVLAASIRLLPGTEFMQNSWRPPGSLSLEQVSVGAISPSLLLQELFTAGPSTHSGPWHVALRERYLGTATLIVAMVGMVTWKKRSVSLPIAIAAAGAFFYALGPDGGLQPLLFHLPGGDLFRVPSRSLVIAGFAIAFLCGCGLHELSQTRSLQMRPDAPLWILALATIIVVLLAVGFGKPEGRGPLLAYAGIGIPLLTIARWAAHDPRVRVAAISAFALLVLADLWQAQTHDSSTPSRLRHYLSRNDLFLQRIRQRQGLDRTHIWASYNSNDRNYYFSDLAKAGINHQLWLATDYGIASRRFEDYLHVLAAEAPALRLMGYRQFRLSADNIQLLALMGVRYLVMMDGQMEEVLAADIRARWKPALRDTQLVGYEYADVLPRAFITEGVEVIENDTELLDRLRRADLRRVAFLDEAAEADLPLPDTERDPTRRAEILDYGAEAVTIATTAARPGFLVLTDHYDSNWEAAVDGVRTPLHRANALFRGVFVPAGEHRVEFVYRPRNQARGALVSVVGWAGIGLLLGIRSRPASPAEQR